MAKVACPRMAFAKETAIAFTKCCSKSEELNAKVEAFLDKANSIRVPHHLEHLRMYYVLTLGCISTMVHDMDKFSYTTGKRLVGHKNMLKTGEYDDLPKYIIDMKEEMLGAEIDFIQDGLNDVEELLNSVENSGSKALMDMQKVDKPCGFMNM